MSGGIKAGGIFFIVALVLVFGSTFLPFGCVVCAPILALGLGTAAGYLGLHWSPDGKLGQGVLAGALTGLGALIGFAAAFMIALAAINADPTAMREIVESAIEQQGASGLTTDELLGLMPAIGLGVALCGGLLFLVIALGGGALGGWLKLRSRPQPPIDGGVVPPVGMA